MRSIRNLGARGFVDAEQCRGHYKGYVSICGVGNGFVDFTNSGWDNLLVANGTYLLVKSTRETWDSFTRSLCCCLQQSQRLFQRHYCRFIAGQIAA